MGHEANLFPPLRLGPRCGLFHFDRIRLRIRRGHGLDRVRDHEEAVEARVRGRRRSVHRPALPCVQRRHVGGRDGRELRRRHRRRLLREAPASSASAPASSSAAPRESVRSERRSLHRPRADVLPRRVLRGRGAVLLRLRDRSGVLLGLPDTVAARAELLPERHDHAEEGRGGMRARLRLHAVTRRD